MYKIDNSTNIVFMLAFAYLLNGQFKEGIKLMKEFLQDHPDQPNAMLIVGQFYLKSGNFNAARDFFTKAFYIKPEKEKQWSGFLDAVDYAEEHHNTPTDLQKYTGIFRYESSRVENEIVALGNIIVARATMQGPLFLYFTSDSTAVSPFFDINISWNVDSQGKIIKTTVEQQGNTFIAWKQDSLILNANELFEIRDEDNALPAFREAYTENPEHYYLANYIKHLQFLQSPEYEGYEAGLEEFFGSYNDSVITIKNENGELRYQLNDEGLDWEILPLSGDLFMVPGIYNSTIKVKKDESKITGFSIIRKGDVITGRKNEYSLYQKVIPGSGMLW